MEKIVIAIIESKHKVLLSKVKKEKLLDFGGLEFVFPGGRVEEYETPHEAIVREVREETGLNVTVIGQISFRVHPITFAEIYYYHCQSSGYDNQDIPINQDIESLHWVAIKDIGKFIKEINPDISRYLHVL